MVKSSRRRRASWGSLKYDARTRTARIRYWAEGPDGYRRRSRTVRDVSRREAEQVRARLMVEHGEDAPCPTVGQVWERWVLPTYERRFAEGELSRSSLTQYRSAWRNHVAPRWADVPCDEVRALAVQQWISDGRTLNQARAGCNLMSAIMDVAVRYEVVPSNVMRAKYVMPSKSSVARRDRGVWTLAQLGEVWRCVHGAPFEAAFLLSAFGSCRVGESLAVTVADVSSREVRGVPIACACIDKQVPNRGSGVTSTLKTPTSERTVVMAGRAALRLSALAATCDGAWLCDDGIGHVMPQQMLSRLWAARVPDEIRHPFQNLRNSWQTNMRWELGVAPYYTEALMGHIGQSVTGKYYDRPSCEQLVDVVAKAWRDYIENGGVDPLA